MIIVIVCLNKLNSSFFNDYRLKVEKLIYFVKTGYWLLFYSTATLKNLQTK